MQNTGFGACTCFATWDGLLPVEWLAPGDQLATRSGPGVTITRIEQVPMVAQGSDADAPPDTWPYVIQEMQPHLRGRLSAPLIIAPDQAVLVGGASVELHFGLSDAAVPAHALHRTARRSPPNGDTSIYHLHLARPAIVLANGIWCAVGPADSLPPPRLSAWEAGLLEAEATAPLPGAMSKAA